MSSTPNQPTPPSPSSGNSRGTRKPVIGITMGDPAGIGPEVVVKALADPQIRGLANFVIYGMNELLAYAADLSEIEPFWWRTPHDSQRAKFELFHDVVALDYDEYSMLGQVAPQPTKGGGVASLSFLNDAIEAAMRPAPADHNGDGMLRLDAIVTAPVCKESWQLAKCRFPGHTEFLAHKTNAKRVAMMFDSPGLRVCLATTHLALMDVRNVLTIGRIFDAIQLGHEACLKLGVNKPRIAVCGLNPHASENGLFGDEEQRLIEPAIAVAREQGIEATGPWPADTVFHGAVVGKKFDLVVAMYHDQGLIPVKLLGFDQAVNVSLGLPIIRTSVDHGTAFDIVGKNVANPGSMKAAIRLAAQFARTEIAARAGASTDTKS